MRGEGETTMEPAKISSGGFMCLILMVYCTAFAFPPVQVAVTARQAGWVGVLVATVLALALCRLAVAVGPRDPEPFMPAWIEAILGTWPGRLVNGMILLYFLLKVGVVFRHIQEVVAHFVLPRTPPAVGLALMAIPAGIAARLGVEVLSRVAQFYLIIVVGAFVVLAGALGYAVDVEKLLPVSPVGLGPILLSSLVPAAFLSEVVFGVWLVPYLHRREDLWRATAGAVGVAGLFILVIVVYLLGIFGYREVQRMLIPPVVLARSVRLGEVFERLDILLIGSWLLAAFLKASLFVYLASLQAAWVGGIRRFRPLAFPVTALGAALSLGIADNVLRFEDFVNIGAFAPYTFLHTLGVPLLLAAGLLIRRWAKAFRGGEAVASGRGEA